MAGNSVRMTNPTEFCTNTTGQNFQPPMRRGWQHLQGGFGRGRRSQDWVQKRNSCLDLFSFEKADINNLQKFTEF